jgi:hypothetical protein
MKTQSLTFLFGSILVAVLLTGLILQQTNQADGSAFTGTRAFLQLATTTAVGPQDGQDTIFDSDETCNARVITTQGASAIMISFGDKVNGDFSSTTLAGTIGHLQLASTTVVYDSGLYGCGRWTAYAWVSSTLSVSEF